MSNLLPKPDPKLLEAIGRLRGNFDFQRLTKHQQELLDYMKYQLMNAGPADFASLQGRAKQLQDFLDLANKEKL